MIFSSIHANDDLKRYPIAIQKAIEYAKTTDFGGLRMENMKLTAIRCSLICFT